MKTTQIKSCIIIPARLASTRLPDKVMRLINGKPLIEYVWNCGIKANIGPVFVATSDNIICQYIQSIGGNVILTSKNLKSGSDRVSEAFTKIKNNKDFDIIVNLQGDMARIKPTSIQRLVSQLAKQKDNDYEISTLVKSINYEVAQSTSMVKAVCSMSKAGEANALYFSRSIIPYSKVPSSVNYYGHIGVYAFKRNFIEKIRTIPENILEQLEQLEQLRWLANGAKILAIRVNDNPISIDTQEDLLEAIKLIR